LLCHARTASGTEPNSQIGGFEDVA